MSPPRPQQNPITFASFDGKLMARLGHGDDCVMVQIANPDYTHSDAGAIVLTPDDAEQMGRSLVRQAQNAREAHNAAQEA